MIVNSEQLISLVELLENCIDNIEFSDSSSDQSLLIRFEVFIGKLKRLSVVSFTTLDIGKYVSEIEYILELEERTRNKNNGC